MKEIVTVLTSWGPLGLFVIALFDSAGIPLPAAVDALVVAAAAVNPASAYFGAALAVLGSAIGSMVLFHIGRSGGRAYLDRVAAGSRTSHFRERFQTYGLITVFIPALLPIPMPLKVFVLSAGALGVKPLHYLLVVLAARIPRYFGLAYLGSQLGEHTMGWLRAHVWHLVILAVVLAAAMALAVRLVSRGSRSPKHP